MNENTKELAELLTLLNDTPFSGGNDFSGAFVEAEYVGKTHCGQKWLHTLVKQLKENITTAEAYLNGEKPSMNETTYVATLLTALTNENYWTCLYGEIIDTQYAYTTGVQHSRLKKLNLQSAKSHLGKAIVDAQEKANRIERYLEPSDKSAVRITHGDYHTYTRWSYLSERNAAIEQKIEHYLKNDLGLNTRCYTSDTDKVGWIGLLPEWVISYTCRDSENIKTALDDIVKNHS